MDGAYRALHDLRAQGVIRAIGVGINEVGPMIQFANAGDFDTFMLAGRYTLLEQEPLDELLPLCERKGIGILTAGPYNSGILATGATANAKYDYRPAPPEIVQRVQRIEAVCARHGVPLAAAAVQFPLAHPAVSSMVPGAVRPEEVEANVRLIETPIPAALWTELKHERLVREHAPTPASGRSRLTGAGQAREDARQSNDLERAGRSRSARKRPCAAAASATAVHARNGGS